MQTLQNEDSYLEAIKLSLLSLASRGADTDEIFHLVLDLFSAYQKAEPSSRHLSLLNLFLQAGKELGLAPYMSDFSLDRLAKTSRRIFSVNRGINFQYIDPTKAQIRRALGKWTSSPLNSHKKGEAAAEILSRLQRQENGTSYYYLANKRDGITRIFELTLTDRVRYLRDVNQSYLYFFRAPVQF